MGYLDYAGLQYLWGKLKEKFAPKSHSHDDRYYTESEVNTLLASKVHEETITDARDLNTVKTTGIYHLKTTNFTNGPGIANHGTLIVDYTVGTPYQIYIPDSINQAFRRNYNNSSSVWNAWSELKLTDTNTWRGIQNNLTSDSTSDSLSAAQGKVLKGLVDGKLGKNEKAVDSAKLGGFPLNDIKRYFNGVPSIRNDGVMEVGKYIDFHATSDDTSDYAARITAETTGLTISGTTKGTFSGSLSGSATSSDTSKSLKLLSSTRPTSMNFNLGSNDYKGKVTYAIASSSTTDGKPPADSVVQNWSWDNNGYGAQIAVAADANPRMYIRGATNNNGASKWDTSWKTVAFTDDKPATAGTADKANSVDWSKVQNKPTTYPAASHTHPYLPISGGTVTGNTAITGSYLQVPMITGETSNDISGTAQIKKAHGIQLGIPNRDYCNFYEYGGVWNFYKTKESYTQESGDGVLIAKIDTNGVHANLIGTANSAKALSTTVTLTGGDGNTTGYRLVAQCGIGQWTNNRSMFFVESRHQGSGFVVVTIGNNTGTVNQANAYAEIIYYGPQNSGSVISDTAWQVYVSADGKTGYLFWKYNDHSECNVQVINSAFTLSNGTWMTSIGSGYGACKAKTSINPSYTTQRVTDSGNGTWTSLAYSKSGMSYDDYTWLAGWNNYELRAVNKNQFATAGHDHDLNKMINAQLSEATADPQDNDYYISQYSSGGTTTTTYHRRPVKALWNYIKGKADGVYLKLTGGTISGRITHNGGGSWISSRDQVAVFGTKSGKDSFNPVVGQKTPKGAWAMGNLGENERLCFGYTTDANYNAGSNNAVQVWLPAQAGTIITSATIGSQSVNNATTAEVATTGVRDYNNANNTIKIGWSGADLDANTLAYIAGYTSDMKIHTASKDGVRSWIGLGTAAYKNEKTATGVTSTGWTNNATDDAIVPTMSFMAYWNGAYSGTSSNLQYCDRGRFGTIITKGSGDYLPIGGGTLTGDLKFSDIGDTATSHKISWAGSTDGADIYYQTTAKDHGNLVLNLRDDTNCYLRIASNGAFKSYFSPGDGNFHGNVNGNATSASGYTFKSQTSDPGANSSLATGTVLFVYE